MGERPAHTTRVFFRGLWTSLTNLSVEQMAALKPEGGGLRRPHKIRTGSPGGKVEGEKNKDTLVAISSYGCNLLCGLESP